MVGGSRGRASALVGGAGALALTALTAVATPTVARAAATTTTAHGHPRPPAKPSTRQVGHAAFWECQEKTTDILVAVSALTVHVGTPLVVDFVVRNTGSAPCNYVAPYAASPSGSAPAPTATALAAGPCGSLAFAVVDSHRHSVWPGPAAFSCPALGFARLQPGATVGGSGTWDENKPGTSAHVAAGRYTLVVDGHFRFPIRVTG